MNRLPAPRGLLLFLIALLAAGAADIPAQPPPTFPSEVELATVDVVVLDGQGRPVRGLAREDFVVEEDGRPQEIATFEAFVLDEAPAPAPVSPSLPVTNQGPIPRLRRAFAIVLDDVGMTAEEAAFARQAVAAFLERSLRDGDEVTLGTSSGDAWWSARLPEGRADLMAVAARTRGRFTPPSMAYDYMSEYEAFWINNYEGLASGQITGRVIKRWQEAFVCDPRTPNCEGLVRARSTPIDSARRLRTRVTLDAVRRGVESLAAVRGRKSLLLWSRGFLEDSDKEIRDLTAAAREANTAVYFLDTRGLVATSGVPSAADRGSLNPQAAGAIAFEEKNLATAGAQTLADDTGGTSVRNTNDLGAGAERVAEESRAYYLLGFYPPSGKGASEWRKLQVKVARKDVKVRARRGYTLRAMAQPQAAAGGRPEKGRTPPSVVQRVLDSPQAAVDIPLRAMAYVFEPQGKDLTRVLVAAEFDARGLLFEKAGGTSVARLELTVAAILRDTGRTFRADQRVEVKRPEGEAPGWRSLAREFELPPGVAQARVVLREPARNAMGSVSYRFEVPAPGALRLSTPILSDRAESGRDGRGKVQPALAVHRVFRAAGRLYCQYEVFGATRPPGQPLPQVAAGLELRTADGRVVLKAPATRVAPDGDGRVVRTVAIPLDGMADGTYDLMLEVRDEVSGARLERRESFSLAPEGATSPTG